MKIAIVTGASSGMGKQFVMELKKVDEQVDCIWIIARRKERLETVKRQFKEGMIKVVSLDLCKEEDQKKYLALLEEEKPSVKLLVNAAGFGVIGTVKQLTLSENTGMVRLNCEALTAVTVMTLPYMKKGGRIIQLASSAAFLPQAKFAVYAASKSYVLSFSRALNKELKEDKIKVTAVCPGPVATEFFDVAQRHVKVASYKKFFMAKPEKVVAKALRDSKRGKAVSVYGFSMKAVRVISKVIPTSWLV